MEVGFTPSRVQVPFHRSVQVNVVPEVPPEIDLVTFFTQFFVALVPTVLLEFTLTSPGRKLAKVLGFSVKDTSRGYVDLEERTILSQSAFDFNSWSKHRQNPTRYIKTTIGLLGSPNVLKRLQGPLFFFNVISTVVLFYDTYIQPRGLPEISLPPLPFTISSSALGLLLVFRVTNANNRYILARGKWGDILNVSRDLAQQASIWAKNPQDVLDFTRWVPAFSASLMCHLRDPARHDLAQELRAARGPPEGDVGDARGLLDEEIEQILNRPTGYSAPHFVLHRLRTKIGRLGLAKQERLLMEANVTRLINDLGACENILATPIPVGYTKHTTRFLFLWLALLPLALQSDLGIATVFGEQLIAFGLLGIEDIGIQIEEPFAVLPIDRICTKTALEAQVLRKEAAEAKKALLEPAPVVISEPAAPPDVKTTSTWDVLKGAFAVF